jgi:hypothetical protein
MNEISCHNLCLRSWPFREGSFRTVKPLQQSSLQVSGLSAAHRKVDMNANETTPTHIADMIFYISFPYSFTSEDKIPY